MALALSALAVGCRHTEPTPLSQLDFIAAFRSNRIERAQIIYDPQDPYLRRVHGQMTTPGQDAVVPFVARVRLTDELEKELLASGRFQTKIGR
jgi:hypothetical protein